MPEVLAQVAFDVADKLGTLQLIKFEDANGNGCAIPVSRVCRAGVSR